jgi:hypothetical protein
MSAEDYIHQSIVDPNAFIVPECPTGPCPADLMPQNFESVISPTDLDALIAYLMSLE